MKEFVYTEELGRLYFECILLCEDDEPEFFIVSNDRGDKYLATVTAQQDIYTLVEISETGIYALLTQQISMSSPFKCKDIAYLLDCRSDMARVAQVETVNLTRYQIPADNVKLTYINQNTRTYLRTLLQDSDIIGGVA